MRLPRFARQSRGSIPSHSQSLIHSFSTDSLLSTYKGPATSTTFCFVELQAGTELLEILQYLRDFGPACFTIPAQIRHSLSSAELRLQPHRENDTATSFSLISSPTIFLYYLDSSHNAFSLRWVTKVREVSSYLCQAVTPKR